MYTIVVQSSCVNVDMRCFGKPKLANQEMELLQHMTVYEYILSDIIWLPLETKQKSVKGEVIPYTVCLYY